MGLVVRAHPDFTSPAATIMDIFNTHVLSHAHGRRATLSALIIFAMRDVRNRWQILSLVDEKRFRAPLDIYTSCRVMYETQKSTCDLEPSSLKTISLPACCDCSLDLRLFCQKQLGVSCPCLSPTLLAALTLLVSTLSA